MILFSNMLQVWIHVQSTNCEYSENQLPVNIKRFTVWIGPCCYLCCNTLEQILCCQQMWLLLIIAIRDRLIFIGDLGPMRFKFSMWKHSISYLKRKQTKISILYIIAEVEKSFNDYFSRKKYVSYHFLHWSQPPNKYWPVPNIMVYRVISSIMWLWIWEFEKQNSSTLARVIDRWNYRFFKILDAL